MVGGGQCRGFVATLSGGQRVLVARLRESLEGRRVVKKHTGKVISAIAPSVLRRVHCMFLPRYMAFL